MLHKGAVWANTLKKLSVERNLIINSLMAIISRIQLPALEYLDLNLNQVEWDEEEVGQREYKVMKKVREKKQINERMVKVRSVEISIDEDLVIKVMAPEDLYKD